MMDGKRTAAKRFNVMKAAMEKEIIFFICRFYLMNVNILTDLCKTKKAW
jgi:hypothetical protein